MVERVHTGGTKEFVYTKEDYEEMRKGAKKDPFVKAYNKWARKKHKKARYYRKKRYKKYHKKHYHKPKRHYEKPHYEEKKPTKKTKLKKIIIPLIILVVIFLFLYFYPIGTSLTKSVNGTRTEKISERISIEEYLNEQYDGKSVSIKGYLAEKFEAISSSGGVYKKTLTDDYDNTIELKITNAELNEIFAEGKNTKKLFVVDGNLNKVYKTYSIRVSNIAETSKKTEETTRTIEGETVEPEKKRLLFVIIDFFKTFNKECEDGTPSGRCSEKKPFYCFRGELKENAVQCGCPEGYEIYRSLCVKVCEDGTIYGECSNEKPFFCDEGKLIEKASVCGCGYDEVVEGDRCKSKYEINPKTIKLNYGSGRIEYVVYGGLNDYLKSQSRVIWTYDYEAKPTDRDFIMKALDNKIQKKYLDPLVDEIRKTSNNKDTQVKNAIKLVQNIPYDFTAFETGIIEGKYPYEVLYTNKGVCSEKAQLMAYLIRGLGYSVAILRFELESHDAVGIECPASKEYRDTGYCFVEPTRPTAIGHSYNEYIGVGKLKSYPNVIVIYEGDELKTT